jgi:hypothetical protein
MNNDTIDRYRLDPLTDRLHASLGLNGATYVVLNGEHAIATPPGKTMAETLSWVWRYGSVDLAKWGEASKLVPQWIHDCDRCHLLGRVGEGGRFDAWIATHEPSRSGYPSIIVRASDEGSDYRSMPAYFYASDNGARGEAYRLAVAAGFVGDPDADDVDPDAKCDWCDRRRCRCSGGY